MAESNAAAVIDPSVGLDPAAEPEIDPSLGPGSGEPTEDNSPEPEGGEPTPEAGTEGAVDDKTGEDGRLIPPYIRALKATNPEQYKKAKDDFFETRTRRSIHPTVQAARDEHDLIDSLGGQAGIDEMRSDTAYFKEAANQFLKGDPAFINNLWEEDPIAAALHVAPMLQAFKAKDVDGYKSTIARIWQDDFKSVGFAPALRDLASAIQAGDKKLAGEIANSIQEWHDSIIGVATRAEDPRVKTLLAERASQRDRQQETEHQEFLKTYRTDTVNSIIGEGNKIFDSFFRGRKMDPDDRETLIGQALRIADKAVQADAQFIKDRDKHLENGDSKAAHRLTLARYNRELPEAVKRVARTYGMVSGTGKPPEKKPNQQTPGQRVEAGWTVVNARPAPEEIDRSRTSNEMIISGKAILRDGKKVDWSALKKKASAA